MSTEIETDVAVLKRDVQQFSYVFTKLDDAIGKIGDVANGISRMLAVHEERLATHANTDQDLYNLVEQRRQDAQGEIKELETRLATRSTEMEGRIMSAITDLKQTVSESDTAKDAKITANEQRIGALERWRWALIGGGTVIGIIIANLVPVLIALVNKHP